METRTIALQAGQTLPIHLADVRFLMLLDTVFPVTIEIRRGMDGAPERAVDVEGGFQVWVDGNEQGFSYISIASASNQSIKIGISRMRNIGYQRTIGTVSVVDGAEGIVRAGRAYSGFAVKEAEASSYSAVQLWNPVGSGRVIKLRRIACSVGGAAAAAIRFSELPLGTAYSYQPVNKLYGSSEQSVVEFRTEWSAVGRSEVPMIYFLKIPESVFQEVDIGEYVIMPPGSGLIFDAHSVATTVAVNIHWVEEDMQ